MFYGEIRFKNREYEVIVYDDKKEYHLHLAGLTKAEANRYLDYWFNVKTVVKNQSHTLLSSQKKLLKFWKFINIPEKGLNATEIRELSSVISKCSRPVILSPVPLLFKELSLLRIGYDVFHNSGREKYEFSGGKVVYTTPRDGWEIL